jgi:hypothetical protein
VDAAGTGAAEKACLFGEAFALFLLSAGVATFGSVSSGVPGGADDGAGLFITARGFLSGLEDRSVCPVAKRTARNPATTVTDAARRRRVMGGSGRKTRPSMVVRVN